MGEYAIRKTDGERVKIGTCESMYYLRYDDRNLVRKVENSLDPSDCENLFWRLPFPDEDNLQPGDYKEYNRGLRLTKPEENPPLSRKHNPYQEEFSDPSTIEDPGITQFTNKTGMLLNVKCFHGEKLPKETEEIKAFWNGRSWFYELAHVKNTEKGLLPVVHCRHCQHLWRYSWDEILPYVQDPEMKKRLEIYALTVKP
jgi:hypothetical protein